MRFYICKHCGNIIAYLKESGVKVVCCGEKMEELIPNTSDGASEKHVPKIEKNGRDVTVTIGEVNHPMIDVHYIEWIALETKKKNQRVVLKPNDEPVAKFIIDEDDEVVRAYAYCNLHSLWVKEA